MTPFTIFVVFAITWWTVLFAVLPFGVRRTDDPEVGHDTGAPERPMLVRKAVITTVLAAAITGGIWGAIESDVFSFRELVEPW